MIVIKVVEWYSKVQETMINISKYKNNNKKKQMMQKVIHNIYQIIQLLIELKNNYMKKCVK